MKSAPRILLFLGLTALIAVALFAIGYTPTVRLAGREAVGALGAGLAISLAASWLGVLPIATIPPGTDPKSLPTRALASMLVRFVTILVLGLAVALSGWFPRRPLLLWLAASHLVFLIADTTLALRIAGTRHSE